tara:strand:+ start:343 stop:456 length:114 start_codon:yes stop_codon:yes gene_type:complete
MVVQRIVEEAAAVQNTGTMAILVMVVLVAAVKVVVMV